jgi:hypothetical protein
LGKAVVASILIDADDDTEVLLLAHLACDLSAFPVLVTAAGTDTASVSLEMVDVGQRIIGIVLGSVLVS